VKPGEETGQSGGRYRPINVRPVGHPGNTNGTDSIESGSGQTPALPGGLQAPAARIRTRSRHTQHRKWRRSGKRVGAPPNVTLLSGTDEVWETRADGFEKR
jgi:hypothetical protein